MRSSSRTNTLVLDLDETLIHATPHPARLRSLGSVAGFGILPRPGLHPFLAFSAEHFELVVWSASEGAYVEGVLDLLRSAFAFECDHVVSRDHCTPRATARPGEPSFRKELRTLRHPRLNPRHTLCVDNHSVSFERDLKNVIEVHDFRGDPDDDELRQLQRFLEAVFELPFGRDVRQLNLRSWRDQVAVAP